jgi:hypothetical protein
MRQFAQEGPDLFRILTSEDANTGRTRGWSVTGSTSDDNRLVFRTERREPGETEPEISTITGTPLELFGQLTRHLLRSLVPRRGSQR